MQQPVKPASPGDMDRAHAYRFLAQARFQSGIQSGCSIRCIEKCIATDDLYTSNRAKWPIKNRLEKDMAEKTCVKNCGQKYEELFTNFWVKSTQKETEAVQAQMMMRMMMPPQ